MPPACPVDRYVPCYSSIKGCCVNRYVAMSVTIPRASRGHSGVADHRPAMQPSVDRSNLTCRATAKVSSAAERRSQSVQRERDVALTAETAYDAHEVMAAPVAAPLCRLDRSDSLSAHGGRSPSPDGEIALVVRAAITTLTLLRESGEHEDSEVQPAIRHYLRVSGAPSRVVGI